MTHTKPQTSAGLRDERSSRHDQMQRGRIETLSEMLAARGVRVTARRRALLEILATSGRHLDAAALLEEAKKRMKVDRATVYRTLELLKKKGMIDELDLMHLEGEMHYYEVRTAREHFHLACFQCGRIEEVQTPLFDQLKQQVASSRHFQIETARLEIGGYCSRCANTDEAARHARP